MSIALELEPYEYSTDLGPDDLSDVDLDHPNFRAAFPDGKVPIVEVPMPRAGLGDGFFAWAENVLTVHEHAQLLNVDGVSRLRDQIVNHEIRSGDGDTALMRSDVMERKVLVSRLMQEGMTLRQIARYLQWTDRACVAAVSEKCADRAEQVLACDEALAHYDPLPVRALSRRHSLDQSVVNGLKRLRAGLPFDARSAGAWEAACTRVEAA